MKIGAKVRVRQQAHKVNSWRKLDDSLLLRFQYSKPACFCGGNSGMKLRILFDFDCKSTAFADCLLVVFW
jgi:hypothetical protein